MPLDKWAGTLLSRRQLLLSGALVMAATLPGAVIAGPLLNLPHTASATTRFGRALLARNRSLSLYNLHTGERLTTVYFAEGKYQGAALSELDYFFRDFRANLIKAIDPHLLDLLYKIRVKLNTSQPFDLISGYRSPATNAMLARRSKGISPHSLHMQGRAADISVPGTDLRHLQQTALALNAGGVGYYPQSNFVHVDTGRVRHWQFDPA